MKDFICFSNKAIKTHSQSASRACVGRKTLSYGFSFDMRFYLVHNLNVLCAHGVGNTGLKANANRNKKSWLLLY